MISSESVRQIQDRLDIVEVIGGYLTLKRAGRNFKALCPFHPEKTPSFMVYPQKQFFICYGCGAGGDMITFVMKHERLEFAEAVELLAQRAGVPVSLSRGGSGPKGGAELYQAQELAARHYHEQLLHPSEGAQAREYLKGRGIQPETWKTFQLGYAPRRWDGLVALSTQEGLTPQLLEKAGLAIPREGGQGWFDRFRHRVIFPIWDARGRVIAFGGRVMEEAEGAPKYMNSPETDLYIKGRVLYGLNLAASHIREQDFCIVVEGYLDLVTPYQSGIQNVVASMGTALTEAQVRLIRRHTRHVVMVYDGDYAGQSATLRGLDLFLEAEMRVKVAALPSGSDPDSLIREQGVQAFVRVLQQSQELFDYKLGELARQFDPKTLEGRIRISQEMLPTIKRVPNAIQRGEYLRRLGELLGVAEGLLWKELERTRLQSASRMSERVAALPVAPEAIPMGAEELLAGLLLEDPRRLEQLEGRLEADQLQDPQVRHLLTWLSSRRRSGSLPEDHRGFLSDLPREGDPEEEWQKRVARWLAWADSMKEKERVLDEVIGRIHRDRRRACLDALRARIRQAEQAGEAETAARLVVEFNQLMKPVRPEGATSRA